MKETYCSYEVSKLLKEKGFDEPCRSYFINDEGDYRRCTVEITNKDCTTEQTLRPTHQMACAWLREVHQLHISIDVYPIYGEVKDGKGRNTCGLLYWHYMANGDWINDKYNPQQKAFVVSEESYKKVVEAALKYVLENLI